MRSEERLEPFEPQSSRVGTAPFLGGAVIYEARTGRLFRLNPTAARMWRSLQNGDRAAAIVGELARTHGVDPATVRRDLEAFVDAMQGAGLLGPREAVAELAGRQARPPQGTPALDAAYRVGEVTLRVLCYPAEIAAAFAPLAAPARVADDAAAQARLALFHRHGTFVVTCDGRVVDCLDAAPAARWALVRQLVSAAARHRPWLALLHAGAIAVPAGCLLLCGDSGVGKSSLLAGLVHAGFGFVADDIAPLEEGTGLVWPVPLAISIKQGSWPAIGALFPELARAPSVRFGDRTMRYLWPHGAAVAADRTGYPATAVLFPRYAKGAPTTLTRLDPLRSLALLGEGGSVLPSTDAGLTEFLAWWSRLPAYQLSYGSLDEAVPEVRGLADRPLRGSGDGAASGTPASLAFEA